MGRSTREGKGSAAGVWQRPLPFPNYLVRSDRPVSFAHPAEEEFARILSFYRISWHYEPTSFVLSRGVDGNPLESFTPDFYLPEHQLFIELTTMKQALVTRKNRKLRRLRELYPGVRIKLLYRRDVERLLRAYAPERRDAVPALLGETIACEATLHHRIADLARLVAAWQREENSGDPELVSRAPLAILAAAPGAHVFQRHLAGQLVNEGLQHELDSVRVTRYRTKQGESRVRIARSPRIAVHGLDVLIVADQVNTGLSLSYLSAWLKRRGARRVEICTLVRRPAASLIDTPVRFVGFDVPDVPVAGFGLDAAARFRHLPYLATLVSGFVDVADNLVT